MICNISYLIIEVPYRGKGQRANTDNFPKFKLNINLSSTHLCHLIFKLLPL